MHGLEKLRPLALLLLRVGLGAIFIYYGHWKFGHRQLSMHEMIQDGLPAYFTYLASTLELGGGAALIAGLATRLIGLLLAGEMAVAIWKGEHFFVHPLAVDQYGLALALDVGAFAVATFGGGIISLDTLFSNGRSAPRGEVAGLSRVPRLRQGRRRSGKPLLIRRPLRAELPRWLQVVDS